MWVFQQSHFYGTYCVGFYTPKGEWVPTIDNCSFQEAVAHVNFLNGGPIGPVTLAMMLGEQRKVKNES